MKKISFIKTGMILLMTITLFACSKEKITLNEEEDLSVQIQGTQFEYNTKNLKEAQEDFFIFLSENLEENATKADYIRIANKYSEQKGLSNIDQCNSIEKGIEVIEQKQEDVIETLYNEGYISENMSLFMHDFQHELSTQSDFENIPELLNAYANLANSNNMLTEIEKENARLYFEILINNYDLILNYENYQLKGSCWDCIKEHRRQLFGINSLGVIIAILSCSTATGFTPPGIVLCATIVTGINMGYSIQLLCPMCL